MEVRARQLVARVGPRPQVIVGPVHDRARGPLPGQVLAHEEGVDAREIGVYEAIALCGAERAQGADRGTEVVAAVPRQRVRWHDEAALRVEAGVVLDHDDPRAERLKPPPHPIVAAVDVDRQHVGLGGTPASCNKVSMLSGVTNARSVLTGAQRSFVSIAAWPSG